MDEDEWLAAAPADPRHSTLRALAERWGMVFELVLTPQVPGEESEWDDADEEAAPGDVDVIDRFSRWAQGDGAEPPR